MAEHIFVRFPDLFVYVLNVNRLLCWEMATPAIPN